MEVKPKNECAECVRTFVDELKGIADNIEHTQYSSYGESPSPSTRNHDIAVIKKVAEMFENMFACRSGGQVTTTT